MIIILLFPHTNNRDDFIEKCEKAYIAGIIDGEGMQRFHRNGRYSDSIIFQSKTDI